MRISATFLAFALCVFSIPAAAETTVRLAIWNIANLYHREGVALRPGAAERDAADFAALRAHAKSLDADIIALQEVNSVEAVHRVFPPEEYQVVIDGRRARDVAEGRRPPAEGGQGEDETDGIYTAFAVRRDAVEIVETSDVPQLGIGHPDREGIPRSTRWGLALLARAGGHRLRLLNVHLKSSCHTGRITQRSRRDHCVTLARQVPILEDWIDEHALETIPVIVLGDMNRKIERFQQKDDLWGDLDDGEPVDLRRLPERPADESYREWLRETWERCPTYDGSDHGPIDYFFFDDEAWALVDRGSYRQALYERSAARRHGERLSDHCPATVDLIVK